MDELTTTPEDKIGQQHISTLNLADLINELQFIHQGI